MAERIKAMAIWKGVFKECFIGLIAHENNWTLRAMDATSFVCASFFNLSSYVLNGNGDYSILNGEFETTI